jgi:P4 family phage/plasmid primase-like protien
VTRERSNYERLEREQQVAKQPPRDLSPALVGFASVSEADGASRQRLRRFADGKGFSLAELAQAGTLFREFETGTVELAWPLGDGNTLDVCAIAGRRLYRNGRPDEKKHTTGSRFLQPHLWGAEQPERVLVAEGQTDGMRLLSLDPAALVLALPAGVQHFRPEWGELVPAGLPVFCAFDNPAQEKKEEAKRAIACGVRKVKSAFPAAQRIVAPEQKDWCDWDGDAEAFAAVLGAAQAIPEPKLEPAEGDDGPDVSGTDVGLAETFVKDYGSSFRFVLGRSNRSTSEGIWLHYDGIRWVRQSTTLDLERGLQGMAKQIMREASNTKDNAERQRLWKSGNRLLSNAGIRAVRDRIAVQEGITGDEEEFDRHPHLLQVANGVVDLRTGLLLAADPALLLSRGSRIAYRPEAQAPLWWETLLAINAGDEGAAAAYEGDLGYTLTGATAEHVAFFDVGPTGRNGKTLLAETVRHILGPELCVVSAPGTFLQGRFSNEANKPRDDIARWQGARMIQTSELPEGARFDEDLLKRLTGDDTIPVREGYGRESEFRAVGKLWVRTNAFPALDPDSEAVWSRVRLHEFTVSFLGREDRTLPERLRAEAPGILARLVRRASEYYERGGLQPAANAERVQEIRYSTDLLGDLIERRFERDPNSYVTAKRFREIEREEYEQAGEKHTTASVQRMEKKGFRSISHRVNSKPTKVFWGLCERGEAA